MAVAARRLGLALLALVDGCGRSTGGSLIVRAELDRSRGDFGVVRIGGLPAGSLERARRLSPPPLAVYAVEGELAPGTPPLAGEWRSAGPDIEFRPRFAPAAGLTYVVIVDTGGLAGRPAGGVVTSRFAVPAGADPSASRPSVAIHPAADTLPENLLRWYLDFSSRMRPGHALAHVRLLDQNGREIPRAFLEVGEELWDPTGTRLTLLFDPGRIKRGLRANLESGRPLRAGRRYAVRVDAGWPDASGRPLGHDFEKRFTAGPEDRRGPDPRRWTLTPPLLGSVAPVTIDFGEPLDHALAARLLAVYDSAGGLLDGRAELIDEDTRWRFVPIARWAPGQYQIRVSTELEDLAGNRSARPFDRDQLAAHDSATTDATLLLFAAARESDRPRRSRQSP